MKCRTITFDSKTEFKNYLKGLEPMPSMVNRPTSDAHIDKMMQSVKQYGIQRAINVVVTSAFGGGERKFPADGQHLRLAILNVTNKALFGHLVINENFIDSVDKIIPFISKMNSTAKNWSLETYLNSWCTDGKKDYLFIRDLKETTNYGINPLIEAYSNKRGHGNVTFKDGKFVADKKIGDATLKLYETALEMGLYKSNASFLAFVRFRVDYSTIDSGNVLQAISKNKLVFNKKFVREGYLALFRNLVPK